MHPKLARFTLMIHIVSSVGWLGVTSVFVALALVARGSADIQTVRSIYIALGAATWTILVPLAFSSLTTGLIQSMGTKWGLFKHYWVIFKLVINVFANIVLLMYARTLTLMSEIASDPVVSSADLDLLRSPSVLIHSIGALTLLLIATALSVYKPRALTPYGWRKQQEQAAAIGA